MVVDNGAIDKVFTGGSPGQGFESDVELNRRTTGTP